MCIAVCAVDWLKSWDFYESLDFSVSDITFLSFGVDTRYALRGLTGMVKIKKSIEKLLRQ